MRRQSSWLAPGFPQRLTPGAIRLLQMRRRADTSRARNELGFRPGSIERAVEEAYAFHHARGAIHNPAARVPRAGSAQEPSAPERVAANPVGGHRAA